MIICQIIKMYKLRGRTSGAEVQTSAEGAVQLMLVSLGGEGDAGSENVGKTTNYWILLKCVGSLTWHVMK